MGTWNGFESRVREVDQNAAAVIQYRSDESLTAGSGKDEFDSYEKPESA